MSVGCRREVGALAVFVAAAIVATYPLVRHPLHAIAGDLGDPLLSATILAWDADRARHAFRGLWDAPFLYPHRHTLAYSEHLLGLAPFTTPVEWLSGNAVLAYNIAYIGSYVLAGFGMFLLVRSRVGRTDAAILAGLAFELTPYRLAQTSHLQVLMNGWMPIGLWALHEYFATGSRWWMAAFAAAFALLGLSNGYYFYFFLLPVAVVVAIEVVSPPRLPPTRVALDLVLAALALAAIVAPIAWVYFRLQHDNGFSRSEEDLAGLSAQLADYVRVPRGGWTWRGLLKVGAPERELFHGFVTVAFAALALLTVRTRTVAAYLTITILAAWLSMGPAGGSLYSWLFHVVPGFNGLRVPARFASVVAVGLIVLAGVGFAWVLDRLPRGMGGAWAVAIGAIVLLEGQHGVGLSDVPALTPQTRDGAAYDWLRTSPPGAALELNVTQQDDFHPFTTMYQLETLGHGHPIVNGYSGWKSMLQELLGGPASPLREAEQVPATLDGLRAIGVRYVLLHEDTFSTPDEAARLVSAIRTAREQVREERRFGRVWAWRLADADSRPQSGDRALRQLDPRTFELRASQQEDRLPFVLDRDLDTRWLTGEPQRGGEWIDVRLPRATDVDRVQLVTAQRSLADYPRRVTIECVEESGASRVLFDGPIVDRLVEALAVDEQYPRINIDVPSNRTVTLRIRQTGRAPVSWWSVHELNLWARQQSHP